jgi:hypothetical protein
MRIILINSYCNLEDILLFLSTNLNKVNLFFKTSGLSVNIQRRIL